MAQMNIQSIRRMVDRMRADPKIQAIIARNTFTVAASVPMILNMNCPSEDYRHRVAFQRCEALSNSRWRRRISERKGNAILDTVIFEFESTADATALRGWLKARGW
jgi:hypothetical protein